MRHTTRLALCVLAAACAPTAPAPAPAPAVTAGGGARCREVARRAARQPTLRVDVLPTPIKQTPPILRGPFPRGVIRNGYAEIHATVVVDTLGRPVMRTFHVEKTSHPYLARDVRSGIQHWRFAPAQLEGCLVPRVYRVDAKAGGNAK